MSLKDWLDNGWLKQHQTNRQEITDLLSIVERDLADAEISALSVDWRFGIALDNQDHEHTNRAGSGFYHLSADIFPWNDPEPCLQHGCRNTEGGGRFQKTSYYPYHKQFLQYHP